MAANYWAEGTHPRSEASRRAWYRRNGGEYRAWRLGVPVDPACTPTVWQRMQSAALRADLKDQEQAAYIDLDDADVAEGVQTLEAIGLLNAGRAMEIIGATVQPEERP